MNLFQTLQKLQEDLVLIAGEFARSESERIATFLLGATRSDLYLNGRNELPGEFIRKIENVITRRLTNEPLAYILGSNYFFDREIAVTPDVLIPRTDTETLIEAVLHNERSERCRFLDFGTGSGCIVAVLSGRNPRWKAVGIDKSMLALRVARKNCGSVVDLICGSHLFAIKDCLNTPFDFIVSNPPYIPSVVLPTLPGSVRDFEPVVALDGGADGLYFYRYLAEYAPLLLIEAGRLYCEIGYDQGEAVKKIMTARGWKDVRIVKDLGRRDRVVHGKMSHE